MGDLTEIEIFDCLETNLGLAAADCYRLAVMPAKGPTYHRLRTELKLVEGACRQAAMWRGDTRWLAIGLGMEEAHKRCGGWLRGVKIDGHRRPIPPGTMHPLFVKLGDNLRGVLVAADGLKTQRTGRSGLILPAPLEGPHRTGRPVQVMDVGRA